MSLIFPIAFYVVFKLAPEHVRTGNGAFSSMRVSLGIRGALFSRCCSFACIVFAEPARRLLYIFDINHD